MLRRERPRRGAPGGRRDHSAALPPRSRRVLCRRYNRVVADSIQQLSYELSTQTLGEQERSVSGLRARAGTVLAAASISGSFLGTKTSHGSLDVWSILALIAFGLVFATAIWVLLPHPFSFRVRWDSVARTERSRGWR